MRRLLTAAAIAAAAFSAAPASAAPCVRNLACVVAEPGRTCVVNPGFGGFCVTDQNGHVCVAGGGSVWTTIPICV